MSDLFSNHIGGSSELLVLADIKPGFVPVRTPVSYSARLRRHLKLVDALRRNGLETDRAGVYVGPVDTLRTLQFITWTLIDNDTRMLLSVNFDRSFEAYIRKIVDVSGALLDSIFCHCVGFEGRSSDLGFHKFMEFIEENQAPVDLFAAAAPDVTVDDADYFLEADAHLREGMPDDPALYLAEHRFLKPHEKLMQAGEAHPAQLLDQAFGILRALYQNQALFPGSNQGGVTVRDDVIYYNLIQTLMPGFWQLLIRAAPNLSDAERLGLMRELQTGPEKVYPELARASDPRKNPLLHRLMGTFAEELEWYSHKPRRDDVGVPAPVPVPADVQSGLLSKPGKPTHAAMLFLRVDTPAAGRAFLGQMEEKLWPYQANGKTWNLSITHDGLKSIGIHDSKRIEFPRAFREGMAARAGLLGDVDCNHPSNWNWPKANWPLGRRPQPIAPWTIDIIVQVTVEAGAVEMGHVITEAHPLYDDIAALDASLPEGVVLMGLQAMHRRYSDTQPRRVMGHLNFADGVSQPRFDGSKEYTAAPDLKHPRGRPEIAETGDLLVGHKSRFDEPGKFRQFDTPLQDGTFQVIRKTSIDVAGFYESAATATVNGNQDPLGPEWATHIAEKMVGRKQDGSPLFDGPLDGQDFNYTEDPTGLDTPLQSHIRRTNPREFDTPRILRRGFSYGPFGDRPNDEQGMMFICYNASLAEQFEVVQRWVSGGNASGISSWHGDPLLAPVRPGGNRTFRFAARGAFDAKEVVHVPLPDKPMGVLQWGLYAFTPSRTGLAALACNSITEPREAAPATPLPGPINRIHHPDPDASLEDWATLIEDSDEDRREERNAVWAMIRDQGGVLRTKYGVLFGSAATMRDVMTNADNAFSTQEYLSRMEASSGATFLGYDLVPDYIDRGLDHGKEAGVLRDFLGKRITPKGAFDYAYEHMTELMRTVPEEYDPNSYIPGQAPVPVGRFVSLPRLVFDLIAQISHDIFGLAGASNIQVGGVESPRKKAAHVPGDILSAAAYIFGPHPGEDVTKSGIGRGNRILAAVEAHVASGADGGADTLLKALQEAAEKDPYWTEDKIAKTVGGVVMGIAAPASGSFVSVMLDWITEGSLWRLQQRFAEAQNSCADSLFDVAKSVLYDPMLASMVKRAAPDLIHRTAVCDVTLGGVEIKAGERLVGSLASAVTEAPEDALYFLFGGDYADPKFPSQHGCPGRTMGLYTLLGAVAAILDFGVLEPLGPTTLKMREQVDLIV